MKKTENVTETVEIASEPRPADEWIHVALSDLVLNNSPSDLVGEFIDDFILIDRPETPQILQMLEMPTANLIELLRGLMAQGYQTQITALDGHGASFIENLKAELKKQLTELSAESN